MRAAVSGDGAEDVPGLIENHDAVGCLNDLNRVGSVDLASDADRQAGVDGAVELLELLLAPGGQLSRSVAGEVAGVRALPNASEVALPTFRGGLCDGHCRGEDGRGEGCSQHV